jgi:hypothetical protein
MTALNTIRKEVRDLITINEKIQSALVRGEGMTDEEKELIRLCTSELLASISGRLRDSSQDGV